MLVCAAATIVCIVTPNSDPQRMGILSTVVLGAPIIYIVLVCTLFYWILRWKWTIAFVTIVFVLWIL